MRKKKKNKNLTPSQKEKKELNRFVNNKVFKRFYENNKRLIIDTLINNNVISDARQARGFVKDYLRNYKKANSSLTLKEGFRKFFNRRDFKPQADLLKENLISAIKKQAEGKYNFKQFRKEVQGWNRGFNFENLKYMGNNTYQYVSEKVFKETDEIRTFNIFQKNIDGSPVWVWEEVL